MFNVKWSFLFSIIIIRNIDPSVDIFAWPWNFWGACTGKMAARSSDFYCGDDYDAFLVVFRSYCYDVCTNEAVEKIATDEE